MSEPFLAEIKIISFGYAPQGWAYCNGQLMPINQNQALFSLLGTTYGGNGQTTFALPDLRGRIPIHTGQGFTLGQAGGQEVHTVTQSEMPTHTHILNATNNQAPLNDPTNNVLAKSTLFVYGPFASPALMGAESVTNVGGSQPHENRQPYLTLGFIIALIGIFPSRN
ncbi:MAG TPA: tail fiber protein [Pyrinomonadaceae bacterium]|jgi:microcystin-dependent protein